MFHCGISCACPHTGPEFDLLPKQSGEARQGLHCPRSAGSFTCSEEGTSFCNLLKGKSMGFRPAPDIHRAQSEMQMEGYTLNADYSKAVKSG